jgi:hypothetical protein
MLDQRGDLVEKALVLAERSVLPFGCLLQLRSDLVLAPGEVDNNATGLVQLLRVLVGAGESDRPFAHEAMAKGVVSGLQSENRPGNDSLSVQHD